MKNSDAHHIYFCNIISNKNIFDLNYLSGIFKVSFRAKNKDFL